MNEHGVVCKGRREDNNKEVEGYYLKLNGGEKPLHIIVDEHGEYHRIDPETLRRWTGFADCDGERIYEGDVVDYPTSKQQLHIVKWDRGMWIIEDNKDWEFLYITLPHLKRIGEAKHDD